VQPLRKAAANRALYKNADNDDARVEHLHHNHLGTLAVITDARGEETQRFDHYPWGSPRYTSENYLEDYSFTGQERDEVTGFSHHGVRFLDTSSARWTSADPLFETLSEQTMKRPWEAASRYTYVMGDPINGVDLTGLTDIYIKVQRSSENATRTLGQMSVTNSGDNKTLKLFTLELPDRGNQNKISRINADSYKSVRWESPTKGPVVWLEDKHNRVKVLIHKGNSADDTEGCILVGTGQTKNSITASARARGQMIKYIDEIKSLDAKKHDKTNILVVVQNPPVKSDEPQPAAATPVTIQPK
jgi:RHS repeat-associated protein